MSSSNIPLIISNTLFQSFGKIASFVLSFISIVLLTRYLGTSGYGNYTLVFSYLAFFSLIADFGLQFIAVKEIAGAKKQIEKIYGTLFILKFYLVLISTILAIVFLFFFPYSTQLKIAIIIGALAVGVSGMTGYFNTVFQAKVRLDLLSLLDIVAKIGTVASIALFVFLKLNFYFIVSSILIGNIASFLVGMKFLPKTIKFNFDKRIAKKLFFQSIPVGITALLTTFYFKIDTIILSILKTSADVGIYSLSYKILENITLFWFFYTSTVYPLLAKFKVESREKYRELFSNSILLAVVSSIPILLTSYFFAPYVIMLFGGSKFNQSVDALRILLFALPFLFVNTLFYNLFIIEEYNVIIVLGMVASLLFNIVFNLIFVPQYNYIASSYITIFSEIILSAFYVAGLFFIKNRGEGL